MLALAVTASLLTPPALSTPLASSLIDVMLGNKKYAAYSDHRLFINGMILIIEGSFTLINVASLLAMVPATLAYKLG